jgi:hypothetical protein
MNRRDAWMLREYDRELTITPDDREDMAREQERREDIRAQKEEWEWECKRDAELTNPKEEIKIKAERNWSRQPETKEEREEREWREWFRRDEEKHFNRQWT